MRASRSTTSMPGAPGGMAADAAAGAAGRLDASTASRSPRTLGAWLPWTIAVLAVLVAISALGLRRPSAASAGGPRTAKYVTLPAPPSLRFTDQPTNMGLAPDGRSIVAVAVGDDAVPRLYWRRFEDPEWKMLPGTENAYQPFWSPDGRFVGFFAADKLRKIAVAGGTSESIVGAAAGRGGAWGAGDVIVFAPGAEGPLMQVGAGGGTVTPATELDASHGEVGHRFPRFLPDGKHFLYASIPARDGQVDTWIGTMGSKERALVVRSDGVADFAAPDRLVYYRNATLIVQTMDPLTGRLSGEPRTLGPARQPGGFLASPTASAAGGDVLAFIPTIDASTQVVWFGLDGVQGEALPLPHSGYGQVRLSPDGTRAVVSNFSLDASAGSDVWTIDLLRRTGARATFDSDIEFAPIWSPDGRTIYYSGNKTGSYLIYRMPSEGAADPVALTKPRGLTQTPDSASPDGRRILCETEESKTSRDLLILENSGAASDLVPYLATPASEFNGAVSPDGRWAAYDSDETGKSELYVQAFPVPGSKIQISNGGGGFAAWSRDGKRLFYLGPDQALMAVDITPGASLRAGSPVKLFRFPRLVEAFDLAPDGKRVLATMTANDDYGRAINLIFDWDKAR